MHIPEYDLDSWGLLFFRQYQEPFSRPEWRFPASPEEVIEHQTELVVARFCNGLIDSAALPVGDAEHLCSVILPFALQHTIFAGSSTIYTIHPNNVLSRLAHWAGLRNDDPTESEILRGKTLINLVETFNGPAILTLNDRLSFSTNLIQNWTGIVPEGEDPETSTLLQLCRKLRSQ